MHSELRKLYDHGLAKTVPPTDSKINIKKLWAHILAEASIDLGYVFTFVDQIMPKNWTPPKIVWLHVKIPKMAKIIVEYKAADISICGFLVLRKNGCWDVVDSLPLAIVAAHHEYLNNPEERFKDGSFVKVHSQNRISQITAYRGALGVNGADIYQIRLDGERKVEVRHDQLELATPLDLENYLGLLAMQFRGADKEEREHYVNEYREVVLQLVKNKNWWTMPSPEEMLPSDRMPPEYFTYWQIPKP